MEPITGEVKSERKAEFVAEQQPNRERGDDGRRSPESERPRRRAGGLTARIHRSSWFHGLIAATVLLDAAVRALRSCEFLRERLHRLFAFDGALLLLVTGIYTLELLIKVRAEGFRCLKTKSGVFDALVLCAVYLSVFGPEDAAPLAAELRAARLLRILSVPALRHAAERSLRVLRRALYASCLLLVSVLFFGVCGFYFFGVPDPLRREDKPGSFLTAAAFEAWDAIQNSRRIYTVLFVVFIWYNLCAETKAKKEEVEEEDVALKRRAGRSEREEEVRQLYLAALRHLDHVKLEMSRCYDGIAEALRELEEVGRLHTITHCQ